MMLIPNQIIEAIDKNHEERPKAKRYHLGPSSAGNPCDRALWLSFRWAIPENQSGRILRLFRRGQNEEEIASSDLRAAGIQITETGRNQRMIDFGCHVKGSIDGIIIGGIPEAPQKLHVWEHKTHNKESFDKLEKEGVKKSKPEHWLQMQCYMLGSDIDRALYEAVCKNDDRLYFERVELDKLEAEKAIARLQRIALEQSIPAPLSTDPTWYQCKMCKAYNFCHKTKRIDSEAVSCRTCAHSTAMHDGTWHCGIHDYTIPEHAQEEGCGSHVIHPDLVLWDLDQDKSSNTTACYIIDGQEKMNGIDGHDSRDLLDGIENVREVFGK